jgi:hypothetical protein
MAGLVVTRALPAVVEYIVAEVRARQADGDADSLGLTEDAQ